MSNKPTFDANMRYLGYGSDWLRSIDDAIYAHRERTGETPDEIRALIYVHCQKHKEATGAILPLLQLQGWLIKREMDRRENARQNAQIDVGGAFAPAPLSTDLNAPETQQRANPVDKPALLGSAAAVEIWLTVGGSHKQYKRDTDRLNAAGIGWRWLGPIAYRSKRYNVAILASDWEQALRLGFRKSRRQPKPLKGD